MKDKSSVGLRRCGLRLVLLLLLLLLQDYSLAAGSSRLSPASMRSSVTLSAPPSSTRSLLDRLPSGTALQVAPGLEETKLTVHVTAQAEGEVLKQVSRVLGGRWQNQSPTSLELTRDPEVAQWLTAWKRARAEGEKAAFEYQVEIIRSIYNEAFVALDRDLQIGEDGKPVRPRGINNVSLARFIKSFSLAEREQVLRYMAGISPTRIGEDYRTNPGLRVIPFQDLTPEQQGLVREWTSGSGSSPVPADGCTLLIRSDGVGLDVLLYDRNGKYMTSGMALNGAASDILMERKVHERLYQILGSRPTPQAALLGASITKDGQALPAVIIEDAALRGRVLRGLPSRPLAAELLVAVAKHTGLNLVADHHTRSTRLSLSGNPTVQQALEMAAKEFQLVIRQEGKYLLARNRVWPDRDDEEPPSPAIERWLLLKEQDQSLPVSDIALMGRMPDVKLAGLMAYEDGKVHFKLEVRTVKSTRWVWALLPTLRESQRQAAQSKEGLPFRELDLRQRQFVIAAVRKPADWSKARLYLWDESQFGGKAEHKGFRMVQLKDPDAEAPIWYQIIPLPVR